jgi:hypothetical protein
MSDDQELLAMTAIARALEPLDGTARGRALGWAAAKFGILASTTPSRAEQPMASQKNTQEFADLAELFAAADAQTEKEKALVAAYWFQFCQNQTSFGSQILNAGLKDLGHGIANITRALEELKNEKPALILQLQKSGSAKQARKTYRLTQEGAKRIQQMLKGDGA